MIRWNGSLQQKFALGTAAGLLLSSLVFLVLFVGLYRAQLRAEQLNTAQQLTQLLQTALENAMLKRDLEGLRHLITHLGQSSGVLAVRIANPAGEVRFASDAALLGTRISLPKALDPNTPQAIQTGDLLRTLQPVANRPPCQECHGAVDAHPINGLVAIDFDAVPLRRKARRTTFLLMGAGALIVLLNLVGGWWFMRRYVVRPVRVLTQLSRNLGEGKLDSRVHLSGRDELTLLGQGFNHMAQRLQEKMKELEEKELFLQRLVDNIPDGIRVIDEHFRVVLWNRAYAEQVRGAGDAPLPDRCYAATHRREHPCPDHLITCPVVELGKRDQPLRFVHRHRRLDGGSLDVELYAASMEVPVQGKLKRLIVESIRDLDQEIRFSHEQKLAELGRLAAGVAHEIYNPLAAVRMALHVAKRANEAQPPQSQRIAEHLDLIDREIDQCVRVTERLLKLSVPPPESPEIVCVDQIIEDNAQLLRWEAQASQVRIQLQLEKPLRVLATDSELRMVVLNLCQNAIHAMPQGGTLTIRGRRADGKIQLCFEDTGVGIPSSDFQRIFEPFFSRRADGVRGTGLGLPITKSIVENYQGNIQIESEPGEGTRILLTFPDLDQGEGQAT